VGGSTNSETGGGRLPNSEAGRWINNCPTVKRERERERLIIPLQKAHVHKDAELTTNSETGITTRVWKSGIRLASLCLSERGRAGIRRASLCLFYPGGIYQGV